MKIWKSKGIEFEGNLVKNDEWLAHFCDVLEILASLVQRVCRSEWQSCNRNPLHNCRDVYILGIMAELLSWVEYLSGVLGSMFAYYCFAIWYDNLCVCNVVCWRLDNDLKVLDMRLKQEYDNWCLLFVRSWDLHLLKSCADGIKPAYRGFKKERLTKNKTQEILWYINKYTSEITFETLKNIYFDTWQTEK